MRVSVFVMVVILINVRFIVPIYFGPPNPQLLPTPLTKELFRTKGDNDMHNYDVQCSKSMLYTQRTQHRGTRGSTFVLPPVVESFTVCHNPSLATVSNVRATVKWGVS